jgi:hypothetical protein
VNLVILRIPYRARGRSIITHSHVHDARPCASDSSVPAGSGSTHTALSSPVPRDAPQAGRRRRPSAFPAARAEERTGHHPARHSVAGIRIWRRSGIRRPSRVSSSASSSGTRRLRRFSLSAEQAINWWWSGPAAARLLQKKLLVRTPTTSTSCCLPSEFYHPAGAVC